MLIVPYHPANPTFKKIINELWKRHESAINTFIKKTVVAFKRPQNVKDILTRDMDPEPFHRSMTPQIL
jgi:hypothetical protein